MVRGVRRCCPTRLTRRAAADGNAARESIGSCPFHFKGERAAITLSAGLTAFVTGDTAERAFERADRALYRAKDSGRNRVEPA